MFPSVQILLFSRNDSDLFILHDLRRRPRIPLANQAYVFLFMLGSRFNVLISRLDISLELNALSSKIDIQLNR